MRTYIDPRPQVGHSLENYLAQFAGDNPYGEHVWVKNEGKYLELPALTPIEIEEFKLAWENAKCKSPRIYIR